MGQVHLPNSNLTKVLHQVLLKAFRKGQGLELHNPSVVKLPTLCHLNTVSLRPLLYQGIQAKTFESLWRSIAYPN